MDWNWSYAAAGTVSVLVLWKLLRKKDEGPDDPELEAIRQRLLKGEKSEIDLDLLAQKLWREEEETAPPPEFVPSTEPHPEEKAPPAPEEFSELERHLLSDPRIENFFKNSLLPFVEKMKREEIYETVLKLLALLKESGESVGDGVPEKTDRSISYSILRKVPLLDHSLNVAEIGVELVRKEIPYVLDTNPGKYFLIFLGHDIGKAFMKEDYATGDHPILSARVLSEMLPESYPYKHDILYVVEKHHLEHAKYPPETPREYDLYLLQAADRLAREKEISSIDVRSLIETSQVRDIAAPRSERPSPGERQPVESDYISPTGITVSELLAEVLPVVNRTLVGTDLSDPSLPIPPNTPENSFVAVSQPDGVVYVRPDVIYEAFLKLLTKKAVEKENASLLAMDKNEALKHLVRWLMENDAVVPGHVKPGYIGRWYGFKIGDHRSKAIFVPLRAAAFGLLPGDFEKNRKESPKASKVHSFEKISPSRN